MRENHVKDGNAQDVGRGIEGVTAKNTQDYSYIRDENSLRLTFARQAIQFASVPGRTPDRVSQGISEGEQCAVCEMSIQEDALGYTIEFTQDRRNFVRYHLHNQCFAAWEYACGNVEIAGSGLNREGARANDNTPKNGRDPGPGQAGA